jgi:outer membrane protein assembly factor BamB
MLEHGFHDAHLTMEGPDGGVDVQSTSAVAQVKAQVKPVGRPQLQQLYGIARAEDKRALFFGLGGYTPAAFTWADETGMCLFGFDLTGDCVAENQAASLLASSYDEIPRPSVSVPPESEIVPWGDDFPVLTGNSFDDSQIWWVPPGRPRASTASVVASGELAPGEFVLAFTPQAVVLADETHIRIVRGSRSFSIPLSASSDVLMSSTTGSEVSLFTTDGWLRFSLEDGRRLRDAVPTIPDPRVYPRYAGVSEHLLCCDVHDRVRWAAPLKSCVVDVDFLDDDDLVSTAWSGEVVLAYRRSGELFGFDARSGAQRWCTRFSADAEPPDPILMPLNTNYVALQMSWDDTTHCVDVSNGKVVWHGGAESDEWTNTCCRLFLSDDRVHVEHILSGGSESIRLTDMGLDVDSLVRTRTKWRIEGNGDIYLGISTESAYKVIRIN